MEKVIHFNLFRPDRSIFKGQRNEKAQIQTISCSRYDDCQLYSNGECVCHHGIWGINCFYGKFVRQEGYTKRARKYYEWCRLQKEKYDGIGRLEPPSRLGAVGEYVFVPYSHVTMLKTLEWEKGPFLKKENFTPEVIVKLIKFRPRAIFNSEEIKTYQEKVPPLFLKHLSEQMPELFELVIGTDEYCRKRYSEFSNVGRKAILQTLSPNIGLFKDIHGGLWSWDGDNLFSKNSKMSFGLCKHSEVTLKPLEDQVVCITDEKQVTDSTVFCE